MPKLEVTDGEQANERCATNGSDVPLPHSTNSAASARDGHTDECLSDQPSTTGLSPQTVCECCTLFGLSPEASTFNGLESQRSHVLRHLKHEEDVDLYQANVDDVVLNADFLRRFRLCFPGEIIQQAMDTVNIGAQAHVVVKEERPNDATCATPPMLVSLPSASTHVPDETAASASVKCETSLLPSTSTQQTDDVVNGDDPNDDWDWMRRCCPERFPYLPQIGDQIWYFRLGHEFYVDEVENFGMYTVPKSLRPNKLKLQEEELCQVENISYLTKPFRLIKVELAQLNRTTARKTGFEFQLCYHDCEDTLDFLVLSQHVESSALIKWKTGDRCMSYIDGNWMSGTVKVSRQRHARSNESGSRWLTMKVYWDDDSWNSAGSSGTEISFWDLALCDNEAIASKERADALLRARGGYTPTETEWTPEGHTALCRRAADAIALLHAHTNAGRAMWSLSTRSTQDNKSAIKRLLRRRFYIVNLKLIWERLENLYYRRLEALKFDLGYLIRSVERLQLEASLQRDANVIYKTILDFIQSSADPGSILEYYRLVDAAIPESEDTKEQLTDDTAIDAFLREEEQLASAANDILLSDYAPGDGSDMFVPEVTPEAAVASTSNVAERMSVPDFEQCQSNASSSVQLAADWRVCVTEAERAAGVDALVRQCADDDAAAFVCAACDAVCHSEANFRRHVTEDNDGACRPCSPALKLHTANVKSELVSESDFESDSSYDEAFAEERQLCKQRKATFNGIGVKRQKRPRSRKPKIEKCQMCSVDVGVSFVTMHVYAEHMQRNAVVCPVDGCDYSQPYDYQLVVSHISQQHAQEQSSSSAALTPVDERTNDRLLAEYRECMSVCFPALAKCGGQIHAPTHRPVPLPLSPATTPPPPLADQFDETLGANRLMMQLMQ